MSKRKIILISTLFLLLIGCIIILYTFDKSTYYEKQVIEKNTQYKSFKLDDNEIDQAKKLIEDSKEFVKQCDFAASMSNTNIYDEESHYHTVIMNIVSKYNFSSFDEAINDFSSSMKDIMKKKKISFTNDSIEYTDNNNFIVKLKLYLSSIGTDEKANIAMVKVNNELKINLDTLDMVTPLSISDSGFSFQFLIDYWERDYLSKR